jgi:outer membrane protein OmpA-like peptidoglycan-associated protein
MMRALVLFVLVIFFGLSSSAQELVFGEPIKLSSNVNSEDEELGIVLSSDGKTMYFSRAFHDKNTGGKYAGTDIWMSKKDAEGNWMPAANVGRPWNNKQSNSVIGINQDNTVVYLLNAYSNKSGIAFSKLINGTWSDPEVIPIPGINRNDFVGFYVNPAFDVILISMKGEDSFGEEDLYVSLKDASEKWMEPKNLGPTINTKGFEISPFLSSDKKRLFFSSNGHGGYGEADVFASDRLYESWTVWSTPVNLGGKVNSQKFDSYVSMYKDSIGYFSSNRNSNQSEIYQIAVIGSKVKMKADSINKVILQTRKLLTELSKNDSVSEMIHVVNFEPGLATLSQELRGQIEKLLLSFDSKGSQAIEIWSYYQEGTSRDANYILAAKRQDVIREFLLKKGIPKSNIVSTSKLIVNTLKENRTELIFNTLKPQ